MKSKNEMLISHKIINGNKKSNNKSWYYNNSLNGTGEQQ